jgi:hypothetical protein
VNIWLTEDDANLDKASGGLVIYDKAPPAKEVFETNFAFWNNELYTADRLRWLEENGAGNVTVPYRENRSVIFESRKLHATDKYEFKTDYDKRRINLTLLFGDGRIHAQKREIPMSNSHEVF